MNLQTHIPEVLWQAVAAAYEAENYSHAILEATYCISNLMRERAGVDGDGAALVGQALGGENPKLKLNALLTESEKNVQKGFEQILRGIYVGIRNPRSHEPTVDDKDTADAVIHFLGYVAKLLSASREVFTIETFVQRVFDPEFVESQRYAELVVSEIPRHRISEAAIALFRSRRKAELRKLRFLVPTLLGAFTPTQLSSYMSTVSDEFRTATDEADIRTAIQMLSPAVWPSIEELPRLRIENKLISGIKAGEVLRNGKTVQALATWSNDFLKSFTQKSDAASALLGRLESTDPDAKHYACKYFMRFLPEVMTTPNHRSRCLQALVNAVRADDENVRSLLISWIRGFPEDWQVTLAEDLADLTDEENPAVHLDNGKPFLSSPSKSAFDDDIPF